MHDRSAVQIFHLFQEPTRVCLCVCCQPDDAVYLSDESLLQEYVINEDGAMYMGTWDNIQCIPWNYGQVTITHKTPQTPTCWVWRTYNPVSAKWRKVDFFQFWWVQGPFPNSWYLFTLPWSCLLRSLGKLCCTQSCNVHVRQVSKGIVWSDTAVWDCGLSRSSSNPLLVGRRRHVDVRWQNVAKPHKQGLVPSQLSGRSATRTNSQWTNRCRYKSGELHLSYHVTMWNT